MLINSIEIKNKDDCMKAARTLLSNLSKMTRKEFKKSMDDSGTAALVHSGGLKKKSGPSGK